MARIPHFWLDNVQRTLSLTSFDIIPHCVYLVHYCSYCYLLQSKSVIMSQHIFKVIMQKGYAMQFVEVESFNTDDVVNFCKCIDKPDVVTGDSF